MDLFASSVVQGIVQGSLYALIALGPSLTYGLLRILDVANAAGLALGAYVGLEAFTLTGQWWLALVAGVNGMVYDMVYHSGLPYSLPYGLPDMVYHSKIRLF